MSEDVGARVVMALGEPAARELLDVLERPDADRAAAIGRLYSRDDARWIAELLMDLEDEVGEIARLRLVDELAPRAASRLVVKREDRPRKEESMEARETPKGHAVDLGTLYRYTRESGQVVYWWPGVANAMYVDREAIHAELDAALDSLEAAASESAKER